MENIINKLNQLNIETNRIDICPFDGLNLINELMKENSEIKNIIINTIDNSFEYNFLKDVILDENYINCHILLNNYYCNGFLEVFFIINNPYLFNNKIFDIIYRRKEEINNITLYIKKCWNIILNTNLRKFYNSTLINKWIETLEYKIINKNDYLKINNDENLYNKYLEIYEIFDKNVCEIREFVFYLHTQIKNTNHPGCYNLNHDIYYFYVKLNTGLEINNYRINKIFKYALKELRNLSQQQYNLIRKILPELSHLKLNEMIMHIKNDPKFKFKSKEDYKNIHKELIDKLHKYFIEKHQIKEYNNVNLIFIDDPNLSTAYWAFNTFYLNVAVWDRINTFESLALTLHEAIPGHHTQLNYSIHSNNNPLNILYHLFGTTNGFCEGWGLFAESAWPYYTDIDHIGRLQYEILRTLRIIVDIAMNFVGISIDECKKFMKNFITVDDKIIESELYRYISIPGQALCYKLGCDIFRKIKEKYIKSHINYVDNDIINLYKKIIYGKEKTLESLMKEYNLSFERCF